jgi:hypothetical protein
LRHYDTRAKFSSSLLISCVQEASIIDTISPKILQVQLIANVSFTNLMPWSIVRSVVIMKFRTMKLDMTTISTIQISNGS